jgi:hypothetical protein
MEDIIDIIVTETTNTIEIMAQPNDEIIDVNIIDNREDVTLNVTPTVVEININSLTSNFGVEWGDITGTLADQEDLQDALDLKANLVGGKVPASELPSYVDDVVEVANFAALPATGETGKIYITLDNNKIYRWSGSVYVEIADSTAVWGAITGTLSSQTDLQSALDAKLSVTTATSTYVPYTGATANVNLGTRDLTADAIYVTNMTAGDGAIFAGGTLLTIANWNPEGRIAFRVDAGEVAVIINKDKTVSFYSAISATFATFTEVLTGTSAVFNAITADYGISLTNIHDSSQGLLVRATHNDADLYLLRLQSSNGATSETWVDRFTVSKSGVATFSNSVTANSFIKSGGTSSQFLKADGSIDSSTYLTTSSASSTYVPYTGATANVDLGTHTLLAAKGTFSSSGSDNTVDITHSSGSGIALNISKAGNGEGIYVNKSSGSGNAVTIVGTLNATTLVKNGGTSSQFLKADGSVDSNTYLTTGTASSTYLPLAGGTMTGAIVGTTATFAMSGSGIALGVTGSGTGDAIRITHSSGRALTLNSSGSGFGILINNDTAATSAPFTIQKQGAAVITFTDAGTANFTGALSGTSATFSSNAFIGSVGAVSTRHQLRFNNWNTTNSYPYITLITPTGSLYSGIGINTSNDFVIGRTTNLDTDFTQQDLKISNSTGAATFSSSVTASKIVVDGASAGNVSQFALTRTDSSWGIFNETDLRFYQSNSNTSSPSSPKMVITTGGNVGIGTTTPSHKLHSYSTDSTHAICAENVNPSGDQNFILFRGGANIGNIYRPSSTNDVRINSNFGALIFATDGSGSPSPRMTISNGGNVGIGTTNPYNTLTVEGASARMDLNNAGGASRKALIIEPLGYNSNAYARIESYNYGTATGGILAINTTGGNVGIGTTAPANLVVLEKSSNSGSGSRFPRLAIKNTLATQGDGSSTFNFADIVISSGNESVNMFLATTFAAGTWAPAGIINVSSNHDLQFKTNNTERMRIKSNGIINLSNVPSSASGLSSGDIYKTVAGVLMIV